MKKVISFAIAIALLVSLELPAAAVSAESSGGSVNERLEAITLSVKKTLGIGDYFTDFTGTLNETTNAKLWSLKWSCDAETLYVEANENGRIVSYSDYMNSPSDTVSSANSGSIPKFPAVSEEKAKTAADAFLKQVLDTDIESADLTVPNIERSRASNFSFSGVLKLNGIGTQINVNLCVNAATGKVTNFWRGDSGQDYRDVTKPSAAVPASSAAATMKGSLNMAETYALPGDGSKTAKLRYIPVSEGKYAVDAVTGKLVDVTQFKQQNNAYSDAKASQASAGGTGLTGVEQATVDGMKGLKSQADLESAARAFSELGLSSYSLNTVNYYTDNTDEEDGQPAVEANLQFKLSLPDNSNAFKSVYLNARTGSLISVDSWNSTSGTKDTAPKYTRDGAQQIARAFAAKVVPDMMSSAALSDDKSVAVPYATVSSAADSTAKTGIISGPVNVEYFTYNRTNGGIPFPDNYVFVGVDTETGYIDSFRTSWDDQVKFDSADGAITASEATDKFAAGAGFGLQYISVADSVSKAGLQMVYAYTDNSVWGVDAITGDLLKSNSVSSTQLTYNDIAGIPEETVIKELAGYGIGFPGGSFKPNADLTQVDALVLIESATGYQIVPLDGGKTDTDSVYTRAYSLGILKPEEKDPNHQVSRAVFLKYFINALGYGGVASLEGIFVPGFADDQSIPDGLTGYVAIAKGMKIIHGTDDGNFEPAANATRVQAAIIMDNYLRG